MAFPLIRSDCYLLSLWLDRPWTKIIHLDVEVCDPLSEMIKDKEQDNCLIETLYH